MRESEDPLALFMPRLANRCDLTADTQYIHHLFSYGCIFPVLVLDILELKSLTSSPVSNRNFQICAIDLSPDNRILHTMGADKQYTPQEVAQHNKEKDMLIIVDDGVYDISTFVNEHPGGVKILKRVAGKDATKQFWYIPPRVRPGVWSLTIWNRKYHNESVMKKYAPQLKVGTVKDKAKL